MSGQERVFAALAAILRRHAAGLSLRTDAPGHLYVELAPATPGARPGFFGAVQAKKSYVSYHLMPVYEDPSLLDGISPALRKRMQGKSCFNFSAPDSALFDELDALTARCAEAATARAPDAARQDR